MSETNEQGFELLISFSLAPMFNSENINVIYTFRGLHIKCVLLDGN